MFSLEAEAAFGRNERTLVSAAYLPRHHFIQFFGLPSRQVSLFPALPQAPPHEWIPLSTVRSPQSTSLKPPKLTLSRRRTQHHRPTPARLPGPTPRPAPLHPQLIPEPRRLTLAPSTSRPPVPASTWVSPRSAKRPPESPAHRSLPTPQACT